MFKFDLKKYSVVGILSLLLVVAGCGNEGTASEGETNESAEMNYTITGVEPGAGQTGVTNEAIELYDSLDGWTQESASTAAMLTELETAISNEEPIVVVAWSPHFKFAKHDLKYLEDPEGIFGEGQELTTIARLGLEEDMPEAHRILDQIQFDIEAVEEAMLEGQETDFDYELVAADWVEANQDLVEEWTEGADPVDGTSIELITTQWDDALFTTNVASKVLSDYGFDVTITPVDPAILFEAIASGDADASLSPWLPDSHGSYYAAHEGNFEDLGPHTENAKIGVAVPAYMEADSLEDLSPKE